MKTATAGSPVCSAASLPPRHETVDLSRRTSFGIGGEAAEFYAPGSVEELTALARTLRDETLRDEGRRPHVLGGGCNTLFPDGAFHRPVLSTERLTGLSIEGDQVWCGAGVRIEVLLRETTSAGLAGMEFFAGIPGSAGGAIAMNAGGSGHSFGDHVTRLEGVSLETGEYEELPADRVAWSYRSANLGAFLVTGVRFRLLREDARVVRERAVEFLRKKAQHQPLQHLSAGCIFKNSPDAPAARLIDRAGLKGTRVGGAVVSERHANFIVNETRTATARDVLELVALVRKRVLDLYSVDLQTEIVVPSNS